jgi:hypothetical protein
VIVVFDSIARVGNARGLDSVAQAGPVEAPGLVSSALVAALRTAVQERDRADSVALTVVSPLVGEEVDAATDSIRALWPGAVRVVRVRARVDSGGVKPTVEWPADGHPPGTVRRRMTDTISAVVAGDGGPGSVVVVAPFERLWGFDPTGSAASGSRVIARWVDGEPAAIERRGAVGCVHDVMVPVPAAGDLVLRPEWRRFAEAMHAACGRPAVVGSGVAPVRWPVDSAKGWRVAMDRIGGMAPVGLGLVTVLLLVAALALLVEPLLRGWRATTGRPP